MDRNDKLRMSALFTDVVAMNNASQDLFKLSKKNSTKNNYLIPAAVLKAFSAELGLKAILIMEGKEPGNIHNLQKLYEMQNSETKINIRDTALKYLNEKSSNLSIDFDKELYLIANDFVDLRYFYEKIDFPNGYLTNYGFLASFSFSVSAEFASKGNEFFKESPELYRKSKLI